LTFEAKKGIIYISPAGWFLIRGEKLNFNCCLWNWTIQENDKFIAGDTYMDNFDMYSFLETIDVDLSKVTWGEDPFDVDKFKLKKVKNADSSEISSNKAVNWRDLL
jgi:hypothetical protein